MSKERVDILVVQQGLADSREKAKRLIMAGQVYDEKHERLDKPGVKIDTNSELYIKGQQLKYVSRGGLKLEKALETFNLDISGQNVLDIGSSTGGFTDVVLQNGAVHSYALDVGTNQLAWKIRQDERVTVMEQTNFRYSKAEDFTQGQVTMTTIDVSFISLRLILEPLTSILKEQGLVVALIKPQFEAGRDNVGKKGIVRDPKIHQEVIEHVLQFANDLRYDALNLTYSPITGGGGNIEFLALLRNNQSTSEQLITIDSSTIREVVEESHRAFNS